MVIATPAHGQVNWDVEINQVIAAINAIAPNGLNSDVQETARDAIGAALVQGTNITITVDDGANTITIAGKSDADIDERARDAVGTALVAGTNMSGIVVNDGANTITINGIADATIDERARDAVGTALVAGTNISIVVDDVNNTITVNHTGTNHSQADVEEFARDAVGSALVAGTNMSSIVLNDALNTITINGISDATIDERARDALGTALTAGAGITVTPNDPGDTITVASTITQYTDEMARDAIGAALVQGAGMTITVDDAADTITLASTGGYTDENARDAIGAALVGGTDIAITVDDGANTITIDYDGAPAAYTDENARDAIGAALVGGSNIGITVDDVANTITLDHDVADHFTQAQIEEFARDALGAALTAGTDIDITVNDGANTITVAYVPDVALPSAGLALSAGQNGFPNGAGVINTWYDLSDAIVSPSNPCVLSNFVNPHTTKTLVCLMSIYAWLVTPTNGVDIRMGVRISGSNAYAANPALGPMSPPSWAAIPLCAQTGGTISFQSAYPITIPANSTHTFTVQGMFSNTSGAKALNYPGIAITPLYYL